MRLILDNVSKRDYKWLLSMARALNFKVTTDDSDEINVLDHIDTKLKKRASDTNSFDTKAYGITDTDIQEFKQRKADYISGADQAITWESIKDRYGLI